MIRHSGSCKEGTEGEIEWQSEGHRHYICKHLSGEQGKGRRSGYCWHELFECLFI